MRMLLTNSYNTVPTIIIVPLTLFPWCLLLLVRLHCEFVFLLFLPAHRETDRFLAASGVQLAQNNFHLRRTAFSSQFKSKVVNILVNTRVWPSREKTEKRTRNEKRKDNCSSRRAEVTQHSGSSVVRFSKSNPRHSAWIFGETDESGSCIWQQSSIYILSTSLSPCHAWPEVHNL